MKLYHGSNVKIETIDLAKSKRYKDFVLKQPKILKVPQGTFYQWLKSKGKLGGQHKVPRLSNERTFIEEILKQIQ